MARRPTISILLEALVAILVILPSGEMARAHPLAPSLLEVREVKPGRAEVAWKTPIASVPGSDLRPLLPSECAVVQEATFSQEATAVTARWAIECEPKSLVGKQFRVAGIAESQADVLLRINLADGRNILTVLRRGNASFTVPERARPLDVVGRYVELGFDHILTGLDHLLFVLGLVLLVRGRRQLLWTITAFTLGHSVTLSFAVLGYVNVPVTPVEALIAFSILILAVELARDATAPLTFVQRFPWVMALAFGLLHGLGFAGALADVGLPAEEIPLALLSFNIGIELGQLLFVAVVLSFLAAFRSLSWSWPARVPLVPAYAIGSLAAFWFFERLSAL